MSECRLVTEQLTSYVDEQLDANRRNEVDRHLEGCVSCRGAVARERGGQTVLREHAPRLREEPLPPGLRSRCESLVEEQRRAASLPGWRRTLVPTVLSVILLVFTASAIFSLATRRSDAVLAAQLTADHSKCFKLFVAGNPPVMDAHEVEEMLAREYGWKIHVPPSVDWRAARSLRRRLDSSRHVPGQRSRPVAVRAEWRHAQSIRPGDVRASLADLDEEQHHVRARGSLGRECNARRHNPIHDEGSRSLEGHMSETPEIPPGPADELVESAAAGEQPAKTGTPPEEPRLSRKAAWLAMGAVTLALALIWIAPGIDHVDGSAETGGA